MIELLGRLVSRHTSMDEETLENAVAASRNEGRLLGEYLIDRVGIPEMAVYRALAEQTLAAGLAASAQQPGRAARLAVALWHWLSTTDEAPARP